MTNDSGSKTTPDLRTFMQDLEVRLSAFSREELNSLLMQHARRLPPRERNDFLAIFPNTPIVEKPARGFIRP
ncbi:MAG: hypothetical protein ACYC1M_08145 [Armatimonadota bacterium]